MRCVGGVHPVEEVDITSYAPHPRWITCLSITNWSIRLKHFKFRNEIFQGTSEK